MSSPAPVLPDYVLAVMDLLAPEGSELSIGVDAPTPGTAATLPAAQVYQADGAADQTGGYAVIDVHSFARTYGDTSALARSLDATLMGYPHVVSSNGSAVLFDRVECLSIPSEIPWLEDNSIRRFRATYSVSFRRR
jgi:hypothetical protein